MHILELTLQIQFIKNCKASNEMKMILSAWNSSPPRKAETGYLPCAYPDGNIPGQEAGDEAGSGEAADAAAAMPGVPGVPGEAVPGEPPA